LHNILPYLSAYNRTFIKVGEDALHYGILETKYIPYLGEVLLGFEIFLDCTSLKREVCFTQNTLSKTSWAHEATHDHFGLLFKVNKRKHEDMCSMLAVASQKFDPIEMITNAIERRCIEMIWITYSRNKQVK